MEIIISAGLITGNIPLYVEFPLEFAEAMKFMWTPECTFVQKEDNSIDLAINCTLANKHLVIINLENDENNIDNSCRYLLTILRIPTPFYELQTFWHPLVWMGNSTYPSLPIY